MALPREPGCAVKADGREWAGEQMAGEAGGPAGNGGVPAGPAQGAVAAYGSCISRGTQLGHAGGRTPCVLSCQEPLRWLQPQLQVATAEY